MKNTLKAMLLVLLFSDGVLCSAIRLAQLLRYTDRQTGLISSQLRLSYLLYALIFAGVIVSVLFALLCSGELKVKIRGNKLLCLGAFSLSALFFVDFVHQCLNCYAYFGDNRFVEYNVVIPLVVSALLSVVSSFYMMCVAITARGNGYDFRSFNVLHFSVVAWAFTRLMILMAGIFDIFYGVENVCEFLLLAAISVFSFSTISAIEKGRGEVGKTILISGLLTFLLSLVLALPRIVAVITGRGSMLCSVYFTSVTYMGIGFFALFVVTESIKTKKD